MIEIGTSCRNHPTRPQRLSCLFQTRTSFNRFTALVKATISTLQLSLTHASSYACSQLYHCGNIKATDTNDSIPVFISGQYLQYITMIVILPMSFSNQLTNSAKLSCEVYKFYLLRMSISKYLYYKRRGIYIRRYYSHKLTGGTCLALLFFRTHEWTHRISATMSFATNYGF